MRASLDWLRDFAALDAPLDVLVAALVDSGTEVERVHRWGDGVIAARVTHLEPIPKARTPVVLAGLDTGGGEPVQVVTGAPNLRPGDLVPWARPGTELPGLDEPLQVRPMFGGRHQSPGMLCSAVELGVGDDAAGILVLERGRPGQPIRELLHLDVVLDLDVTTNRPDCLCHQGIARELAAVLGERMEEPPGDLPAALTSAASVRERVRLHIDHGSGCPRFMAAVIEGISVGPSPEWLQRRLRSIGVRPLNNVVDVTNYVAHELGEPLHAFDLHRFVAEGGGSGGDPAEVVVRRGRGEALACLDGAERILGAGDIAVCSGERAVSIAGIMGGASTAVTPGTTTVLLEAATWDGPTIRASSRRLQLRTDASTLFEKGLSDGLPPLALTRAAALIAELGQGHVLRGVADRHAPLPPPQPIPLTADLLSERLGHQVDANEAATALARLGFGVEQGPRGLRVLPPHFRRDVAIVEDVVEEVGRLLGYGRVPSTLPGRRREARGVVPPAPLDDRVRDVLIGGGLDEVITYSFTSSTVAAALPGLGEGVVPLGISNPLSDEWSVLRTSLLPGLAMALATNLNRGLSDLAVFEIGRAFWEGRRQGLARGSTPDGADLELQPLPEEPLLLGLLLQSPGEEAEPAAVHLRHAQSVIEGLVRRLAGEEAVLTPAAVPGLRPGRSARIEAGERLVGLAGELTPDCCRSLELRGRVVVAELRLDGLVPDRPPLPSYQPPPRFPAVVQDLAVTVAADLPAGRALAEIRAAGQPLLEAVELYDEYRDERLGAGRKGWTFRLTYRAPDRTLTGAEAATQQSAITRALTDRCGATVRG